MLECRRIVFLKELPFSSFEISRISSIEISNKDGKQWICADHCFPKVGKFFRRVRPTNGYPTGSVL
jgi:hypothetical protein